MNQFSENLKNEKIKESHEVIFLRSEVARLLNQTEADRAYIKALQEECKLAHEVIKQYKHNYALKNALETVNP